MDMSIVKPVMFSDQSLKTLHEINSMSSSSLDSLKDQMSSLKSYEKVESPNDSLFKKGLYYPGGEVCAEYIPMSDSDVLMHQYYRYPGVKDPGIAEALLGIEPIKKYDHDGQDLYLVLCEEMGLVPVRCFHRGLRQSSIDLKYYGVNPVGVRAMVLALANNQFVTRLDLTSNHLNLDACFHLGQMLGNNQVLQDLILAGCNIGPEGCKRVVSKLYKRNSMNLLDLSKNDLRDNGSQYVVEQLSKGAKIYWLNISHNKLGGETASELAAALEHNTCFTHLDVSWNLLNQGVNPLLRVFRYSQTLAELNLAWNALSAIEGLGIVLGVPTLSILDLSNNRLKTPVIKVIAKNLHKANKLDILDLSRNPLLPSDCLLLLEKLKERAVKLKNLIMEDVVVNKEFVMILRSVLGLPYRAKTRVVHGTVVGDCALSIPDISLIIMKRFNYITSSSKQCTMDIGVYFLTKFRKAAALQPRELKYDLKISGLSSVDEQLIDGLVSSFPGPRDEKGGKTIDLAKVVDIIRRLWPEKQALLTPPPEEMPPKKEKKRRKKKK